VALWPTFSMRGGSSVVDSGLDCGFIPLLHSWFALFWIVALGSGLVTSLPIWYTEITVRVPEGTIQELFSTLEAGCGVLTSILWI
jgi:hypothetical protein